MAHSCAVDITMDNPQRNQLKDPTIFHTHLYASHNEPRETKRRPLFFPASRYPKLLNDIFFLSFSLSSIIIQISVDEGDSRGHVRFPAQNNRLTVLYFSTQWPSQQKQWPKPWHPFPGGRSLTALVISRPRKYHRAFSAAKKKRVIAELTSIPSP